LEFLCFNGSLFTDMKKIPFFAILCSVAVIFLAGCERQTSLSRQDETTLDKIRRTGELHVGYLIFNPCVIQGQETQQLSGFFVDMVNCIAENLKVKPVYHETTLKDFSAGLNSGQFDLSICATYRTIGRASAVAFTEPIFFLGNGGAIRKEDIQKITKITNLNDPALKIAVLQGQAMHEYARVHYPKAQLIVLSGGDLTAPLLEVSSGRADIGFCNYLDVERYCEQHPELVNIFKDDPIEVVPLAWAVRQNDLQWLNFINTSIDYMESTRRIKQWEEKYGVPLLHEKVTFELRGKK
jgi:ABC-type amino acid transport substrate-binding protein